MNRTIMYLAVAAFVVVALLTPFELFGVPLAPLAAIVFGAGAGWWVAATRPEHTAGNAARAGAWVGLGALLGSIIGLAVLALWIGNIPEVQAFIQSSEPHPEARIATDWIAPLGALAGVIIGFFAGIVDLVLSWIAGWIAGMVTTRNATAHI
jgi:hypothetical protein